MKQGVKIGLVMAWLMLVPTVWAQVGIGSVSPTSATVGDTNVSVTITLSGSQFPPNIDTVMIGSLSASSKSYNSSTGTITAQFNFSSATAGTYDVVVEFTTPSGTQTFTKTAGFTLKRAGGSTVIYVDADSPATTPDGTSWATAYRDLQDALSKGIAGDEIWLAAGTYYPTSGTDREISFQLVTGVNLYGGFAGSETSRDQRNPATNKSILSGDIGTSGTKTDNSYHVLTGANEMTLDGVTVTGGYADGADGKSRNEKGGGMINYDTSDNGYAPTLNNVTFEDNYAHEGGAMYNYGYVTIGVTDSTFNNNRAKRGGAILARVAGNTYITNTTFISNYAEWRGGAINIDYGTSDTASNYIPVIKSSTFDSNVSNGHGGAVYIDDWSSQVGFTNPTFDGCTFSNNRATYLGGAARVYNSATPIFQNSTFTNNSAGSGGGAVSVDYGATVTLNGNSYSGNSSTSGSAKIDTGTNGTCQGTDC